MTLRTKISDGFRIFVDPSRLTTMLAHHLSNPQCGITVQNDTIITYTDRSCLHNGKHDARSGAGVWIANYHPKNHSIWLSRDLQSNQAGKLAAVLSVIQDALNFTLLQIKSDSSYVIEGLTKHLQSWEDQGWINIQNRTLFKAITYHLWKRSALTLFIWVKGHNGKIGNKRADALARDGVMKHTPNLIDTDVPINFDLQGAKIACLT